MKKLLLFLFVLLFNIHVFAQLPITQDFGSGSSTPAGWTLSGDWIIDLPGSYPDCDVAGSSGNSKLFGINSNAGFSAATYTFSGTGKQNITVSWNEYRDDLSIPALSVLTSTDNFVTSTTLTVIEPAAVGTWSTVPSIVLPSSFNNKSSIQIRFQYTSDNSGLGVGIDDVSFTGTSAPIYYWKGTGNLDVLANWGDVSDGSGTIPTNFTNSGQEFNIVNGTSATIGSNWVVSGSGTQIKVGDGVTWYTNFTIPAANSLSLTNAILVVQNASTLTLQNATNYLSASSVSLSTNTTVDFAQSSNVNLWNGATYQNLTISGSSAKSCSGNNTISGILNLNGVNLQMAAGTNLTMNGTKTGSGRLIAALGNIIIGGTGAFGTLDFSVTNPSIRGLTINRSSSGLVTLGNDLILASGGAVSNANFTNGTLDLNGRLLTINRPITFGSGIIRGSTTSSLTISGSGTISGSLIMDQTSAATRSLYDLTMNRSGQTLTTSNALEIRNSVTPTSGTIASGGNMTLKADATRSARVGTVGGSITGNMIVETYAASSGVTGWTNLGSSGINGLTVASWDGQFPITCNGCSSSTIAAGGAFASAQGGNELGTGGTEYTTLSSTNPLTPGVGFWIYLGTGLSTTTPITITETGTATQGTVTRALTKTPAGQNGYNLIANPYASPINWPALATLNTMTDGSAYLYSPVGGAITLNGSGSSTPSGYCTGGVIAMGQGFYVNANSAGTFSFTENNKSTANTSANPLLKATTTNNEFRLGITGTLGDYDETLLITDNTATSSFDRLLDAYKRFTTPGYLGYPGTYSQYTSINSLSNNEDYAINALPLSNTQDLVIPIRAKASITGSYTISPIDIQNLPANSCVILNDKLLNFNHDLRTGSYIFNMDDTTNTPRFELKICADNIVTSIHQSVSNTKNILINQDIAGAYVKTNFDVSTKAIISAYNVMGQKLIADKEIEGKENTTYLDLGNVHSQVVIIKVTTPKESSVKRLFID